LYWAVPKINFVKKWEAYVKFTFTAALYTYCDFNTTCVPVCLSVSYVKV